MQLASEMTTCGTMHTCFHPSCMWPTQLAHSREITEERICAPTSVKTTSIYSGIHPFPSSLIAEVPRSAVIINTPYHITPHSWLGRSIPPGPMVILLPILAPGRFDGRKPFVILPELKPKVRPSCSRVSWMLVACGLPAPP